jgi:RNA polymerase sigma-70 factor (ECF subfamily)
MATAPTVEISNPEAWLDEHGDGLFAYAMGRVRDPNLAEDLVQETLLAAIEARDTFQGRSSLRTWLIGILRHKMLQHLRRNGQAGKEVRFAEIADDAIDAQFTRSGKWKREPGSWDGPPTDDPGGDEFLEVFSRCLRRLPSRIAEAFVLAEQQELGAESLRTVFDTSLANVYVMLHRARAGLRHCMERNWFERDRGKGK